LDRPAAILHRIDCFLISTDIDLALAQAGLSRSGTAGGDEGQPSNGGKLDGFSSLSGKALMKVDN
jgi:hypothetical protein